MEQNKGRFRLKLNLFDMIVILLALAVGAVLMWNRFKPAAASVAGPSASAMEYTIRLQKVRQGTGALVQEGDELEDVVKNYALGRVVGVTILPATSSIINEETETYVTAEIPGYEDIELAVSSTAIYGEENVTLGSGYELRVGQKIYVRGPGYLGSGEVWAIERGN